VRSTSAHYGVGVYHFSSNLPAPINVGSTEQTKTGNLIIEGVLRLGQFTTANAPSGTEGALYFDTTESTTKLYSNSTWGDLGGGAEPGQLPTYTTAERDALSPSAGLQIYNTTENNVQLYSQTAWKTVGAKLALAATCSLDGDCDSAHCEDGICCATSCGGNCDRCNVAGSEGTCTDVASDCTGNCAVCSSGNCAASNALCSNTAASCNCSGSGTVFNCSTCTDDPWGLCGYPTCSSNTCGTAFDNGAGCTTCKSCYNGGCTEFVPLGVAGLNCTAAHNRCDGEGACISPSHKACTGIAIGQTPAEACSALTNLKQCNCGTYSVLCAAGYCYAPCDCRRTGVNNACEGGGDLYNNTASCQIWDY